MKDWVRSLGIAGAYCIALTLFRQVSIPHWIVLTGFHLSALLLVRQKYWPALIAGEMARLAYVSVNCYPQFGALWAVVNLVPSICLFIPIIWMFRKKWPRFTEEPAAGMGALVLCCLLVALTASAVTLGQILITPFPRGYTLNYEQVIARLVLGNFLGVLTVTPLTLALRQFFVESTGSWRQAALLAWKSKLTFDIVFLVVPALVFLVWVGERGTQSQEMAQTAMFLPVIWLALRHGWKGAATGGTLASVGIMVLMPARNDLATLQAELLVAMSISTMLLVGARIAVLDHVANREREEMRSALALAQRNAALGEAQLMNTGLVLHQIRDSFHSALLMLAQKFRDSPAARDSVAYQSQALAAQHQLSHLADGLYPPQLKRGLSGALREGQLARILDEAGMGYWCDTRGHLSALPQALHMAVYRIIGEAVNEACLMKDVSDVRVLIRCGQHRRRWVAVQIDTRADAERLPKVRWHSLLPQLQRATGGVENSTLSDRAATYEGTVRQRSISGGKRVSVLLIDPRSRPGH